MSIFEDPNKNGVYMFHNPETGEAYIGSSNDVERRKKTHELKLKNNEHGNRRFQAAYNRNSNFEFVAAPIDTRQEAFDVEQELLDEFGGSRYLLNMSMNARHCNVEASEETRRKLSESLRGLKRSEETREKIRQAKLGVPRPLHVGERLKELRTGVPLSAEHRAKLSAAQKVAIRSPRTPEHTAKIAAAKTGSKHSSETIQRMRENASNVRTVIVEGNEFPSLSEAARQLNVNFDKVKWRVKSPNYPDWFYLVE